MSVIRERVVLSNAANCCSKAGEEGGEVFAANESSGPDSACNDDLVLSRVEKPSGNDFEESVVVDVLVGLNDFGDKRSEGCVDAQWLSRRRRRGLVKMKRR